MTNSYPTYQECMLFFHHSEPIVSRDEFDCPEEVIQFRLVELKESNFYKFHDVNVHFNKAISSIKKTEYYKIKSSISGHDERLNILLMRIIAGHSALRYAEQGYKEKKSDGIKNDKKYLSRQKAYAKQCIEANNNLANELSERQHSNTKENILCVTKEIKECAQSSPVYELERIGRYPSEKLIVRGVCHMYMGIFGEIHIAVIKNLCRVIFRDRNLVISDNLLQDWIKEVKNKNKVILNRE